MPRDARDSRGFEDDYRRSGINSSRRIVEDTLGREDRPREFRGEPRERTRIVDDTSRSDRHPRQDRERGDPRPDRERDRERERDRADRDDRMDFAVDTRMGAPRADTRANTAVRREEREAITAYRDPRTGQLRDAKTHELIDTSGRPVARPREYDDDRMMTDDPPVRRRDREPEREPYNPRPVQRDDFDDYSRGSTRPGYGMNEYFVDGSGIEREVIQHDICQYLGNDATVRRYIKDGREGYIVRAYRALTTAQLEDLRQASSKYRRQQRSARPADSYAEMRARDEPAYGETMDVDMDYPAPPRDRHNMESEYRNERGDRHGLTPVTTGYGQPNYPAYAIGSGPGTFTSNQVPRTATGGYSPQSRTSQAPYSASAFDSRVAPAPVPTLPSKQVYKDPRTGQLVSIDPGYGSGGFAQDPPRGGGRHR